MKITVTAEEPKDNKVVAKLAIPAADVDEAIKRAYKDLAHKYNFQGFRRGHAPRPVIDGIIGKDAVRAQATNDLLTKAEPLMLEELDIVPIGQVDFDSSTDPVVDGKDFSIEATINVRPDAELKSYDAPEINMPPQEATDAEVEAQLKRYMGYQTTFEDLPEGEAAEKDDVVRCDIENVEGAERFAGEDQRLPLDPERIPAELVDALVGAKVGDVKEVTWTHAHGEGEDAHEDSFKVKVTVKGIQRPETPELTDEFVKKSFGYDTVEDFKKAIRDEITEDKKVNLPTLKEDRLVEALGELLLLDEVPANYQEEVFNELGQEVLGQMQRQGISLDMYLQARGIPVDAFIADLHAQAAERARQSLALDALAKKLGLEATDEDIRSEFERAGVPDVDAAIKQWREEGRLPAIRESIKRSKALNWLVENAKVNEVDEVAQKAEKKPAKKAAKKPAAKKATTKKAATKDAAEKKPAAKKAATKKTTKKADDAKAEDATEE